jgi:GT2 family glycosyltransferase
LYSEEDDLLTRMAAVGGRFGLAHDLFAVHVGEASSSDVSSGWRAAQRLKGRRRYVAKHYSWQEAALAVAIDLLRSSRRLPRREFVRMLRTLGSDPRQGLSWPAMPRQLLGGPGEPYSD